MSSVTTQDGTPDTHARMRDSELPSKLFFRIGEVAGLVGVEPHVLRYWEREFRSIRPTKSAKGQRVYSRKDVENLLRVRDLLYRDGFTIAGAKKRLQRGAPEAVASAEGAHDVELERDRETDREIARTHDTAADLESSPGRQRYADAASEADAEPDEELVAAEPASGPRPQAERAPKGSAGRVDPTVQGKLTALRAEVEAFLDELEAGA